LQVDADGQHDLTKIPALIKLSEQYPGRIISGMPVYDESVPTSRRLWRYATHILVWIHTLSLEIKDSMCGFRIYPLQEIIGVIDARDQFGQRMDFDIEIKGNMNGISLVEKIDIKEKVFQYLGL
jgi:hypothetical protein